MKFFITLCFIASLYTAAWAASEFWGRRLPNDFLIVRDHVRRYPAPGQFLDLMIDYPRKGEFRYNITGIWIRDNYPNNLGAKASLWGGGPYYAHAKIGLRSQHSQGINTTIEIYAK